MRYPPHLLDEIRARLPVSRVVERRVKLKRTGREYTGLSPFKNERTPSFTVNDQKGFYHCFASGEHGDVFKFIMATEGLSFPEAVERLAAEAGVSLPPPVPVDEVKASHEERLFSAMEEACRFFQDSLSTREGTTARDYLDRRGLRPADIQTFRLGYAPDSKTALKSHLSQMGYTPGEMQESGLLIHGEDIAVPYDRFRGRLIFPILDAKRRVIAFGGRALLEGQQPKYLNSPETPLFHKGHVLFNFASAREAARGGQASCHRRRLYGCDRPHARRLCRRCRTAWHGADGGSAPPVVGDGAAAHALLRRGRGRPEGRAPGARFGDALSGARPLAAIRVSTGGPRPRRHGARRRDRGACQARHTAGYADRRALVARAGPARA